MKIWFTFLTFAISIVSLSQNSVEYNKRKVDINIGFNSYKYLKTGEIGVNFANYMTEPLPMLLFFHQK